MFYALKKHFLNIFTAQNVVLAVTNIPYIQEKICSETRSVLKDMADW